jgi:predicted GIY-YIG superfamily endonuclease
MEMVRKKENPRWVIYALRCPLQGKIRYIGKSSNVKARYKQHLKDAGSKSYKKLWIQKLNERGLFPVLEIMDTATTEPEAREKENRHVANHLSTVYNIFMPGKNTPTCHDFRSDNNIEFDCEFEPREFDTDKFNRR